MRRLSVISTLLSVAGLEAAPDRRVAVFDFEFATVKDRVSVDTGERIDLGRGIADLLMTRLIGTGQLTVIDRKSLDKLLAEQNVSNSDRFDAVAAARLGRLLGVDAIVVGSVTAFGRDDRRKNYGAFIRRIPGVGSHIPDDIDLSTREEKSVIEMNYRMVRVETGEAMVGGVVRGEAKRTSNGSSSAGGSGGSRHSNAAGNFEQTVIGEAVRDAVEKIEQQLNAQAARMQPKAQAVNGEVLSAAKGRIVINVGTKQGLVVGDRLRIEQVTFQGADSSGKHVKLTEAVGYVTLTLVNEEASVGTFAGGGEPRKSDLVKR